MVNLFDIYKVEVEQIDSAGIPINVKFPIKAIKDNLKIFEVYEKVDQCFPKLKGAGIPEDLD